MPKILVNKAFLFAEDGNNVVQIQTGEQEVSDRCAMVAVEQLEVATLIDGPAATDPRKMTVPELKEWLAGKNIAFDPQAKKEDLLALVPADA